MVKVFLGLGSNISPKEKYIKDALDLLKEVFFLRATSSLYKTRAYNVKEQEDYLNLVACIETSFFAKEVLKKNQEIEQNLGRKSIREKNQPRTIDIDILFYGSQKIQTKELIVPHYDLYNRDFFLMPLLELADNLLQKKQKKKISQSFLSIPEDKKTFPKKIYNCYYDCKKSKKLDGEVSIQF